MARRLDRTATRLGVGSEDRLLLGRAFQAAMEPRRLQVDSDHHPDYLHTARTALILMDDLRVADPVTLGAALLTETRDLSLSAAIPEVERVNPAVARHLARIPIPAREPQGMLMESLLALSREQLLIAAAERLDHARHLHLRDRAEWVEYHATTCRVYAPVAQRVEAVLGRRLRWWCSTFAERFLDS